VWSFRGGFISLSAKIFGLKPAPSSATAKSTRSVMFAENPVTAVYTIPRTLDEEVNISGEDFIVNWKASQKAYRELKDEWNSKAQAITIQPVFRGSSARDMVKLRQQQIKLCHLKPTQQL